MFTFIKQKLLYKKWLNICLLTGIVLLIAVAACLPMYQNMSENQALQNQMKEYVQENGKYPLVVALFQGAGYKKSKKAYEKFREKCTGWDEALRDDLKMEPVDKVTLYTLKESDIISRVNIGKRKSGRKIKISYMTGMEDHIKVGASEQTGKGQYGCYVSTAMLDTNHLYVGQQIAFEDYKDKNEQPIELTIEGVFEEKTSDDRYWVKAPLEYTDNVFVTEDTWKEILAQNDGKVTMRCNAYYLYDYTKLKAKQIPHFSAVLKRYEKAGFTDPKVAVTTEFADTIKEYEQHAKKIHAILWVLELPILVLILVFIYMISSQILELEGNEVATLKSRGVSLRQIIWIYFCQASLLAGIGMVLGIPIGYAICRLMGQASAFLEFVDRKHLMVAITGRSLLFAVGAALFAVAFMTLPLLKTARVDIVAKKSRRKNSEKSFFERYYIDVAMLLVSAYAYHNFNGQKEDIAQRILNGEGLDPILFLSAVLFMAGAGMVLLRLFRAGTGLVYRIGAKKWSPAMYASFLQIMRTRGRQTFISLFLVVSLGMGIFYSNIARTINQNEEERICYNIGADLVVKEKWKTIAHQYKFYGEQVTDLFYVEPSTDLYSEVKKDTQSATRVLRRNVSIKGAKALSDNGEMMAIQTQEFGETAWMRDGLLDKHWYYYLNDLAKKADNVLVSSNARDEFGLKVGDTITFNPVSANKAYQDTMGALTGTICGFVDAWPGFTGYTTITDEDGKKKQESTYLVVANYGYVESSCGAQPAEIWMKTGGDNEKVMDTIEKSGVTIESTQDMKQNMALAKQAAMIQITNGMLTLSFLVVTILCLIGFLIYWITSIRQRELLFGIYRAMGMSMKEIVRMLLNEQVFCSLLAILCGVISGILTSKLFIALITIAYAPEHHVLPYQLYTSVGDMIRIGMIVLCMLGGGIYILARMLSRMKIAQAIKMGED